MQYEALEPQLRIHICILGRGATSDGTANLESDVFSDAQPRQVQGSEVTLDALDGLRQGGLGH